MVDEHELVDRYLLGTATGYERKQIEQRFIADNEFFEELQVREQELVSAYVFSRLAGARRDQFEKRLHVSPELGQQVEQMRQLRDAISDVAPWPTAAATERQSPAVPTDQSTGLHRERPRRWSVVARWAGAAAAVIVLAGGFVRMARLQNQIRYLQEDRARLERQGFELSSAVAGLRATGEDLARIARAQVQRADQQGLPGSLLQVLTLTAGRQRANAPSEDPTFEVPPQAEVRLEIEFPRGDAGERYLVKIQDATGQEPVIWRQYAPRSPLDSAATVVGVTLPGMLLSPGAYRAEVEVLSPKRPLDVVASAQFTVVRPSR